MVCIENELTGLTDNNFWSKEKSKKIIRHIESQSISWVNSGLWKQIYIDLQLEHKDIGNLIYNLIDIQLGNRYCYDITNKKTKIITMGILDEIVQFIE